MAIGWSALTFTPSEDAIAQLAAAWKWLLKDPYTPVLFSTIGDMFFVRDAGDVWWLNTGTAEVTRVADHIDQFNDRLGTDIVDEWFLPLLVEQLHVAGKVPEEGECYTYVRLPIFEEGRYEVDNMNAVPASEHFSLTGEMHQQLRMMPDGNQVSVTIQ
jgi:hypothetical protein